MRTREIALAEITQNPEQIQQLEHATNENVNRITSQEGMSNKFRKFLVRACKAFWCGSPYLYNPSKFESVIGYNCELCNYSPEKELNVLAINALKVLTCISYALCIVNGINGSVHAAAHCASSNTAQAAICCASSTVNFAACYCYLRCMSSCDTPKKITPKKSEANTYVTLPTAESFRYTNEYISRS